MRQHMITAAATAMSNAEHRKQSLVKPAVKVSNSRPPSRPNSGQKNRRAAKPWEAAASKPSSYSVDLASGWGNDGPTLRKELGHDGGHVKYARKKAVHLLPMEVKPFASLSQPAPLEYT